MIRKKFKNWLFHPVFFFQLLSSIIKKKFIPIYERKAIDFFKSKDIYKYFVSDNKGEFKPDFIDLKNIFELITSRKPKCVLEFGSGFYYLYCFGFEGKRKKWIFWTIVFSGCRKILAKEYGR